MQFELNSKIASSYYFPCNHFSTLIAPSRPIIDVIYNYGHMHIAESIPTKSIDNNKPLWLELIHETNVSNRMHTDLSKVIYDKNCLDIFGIKDVKSQSCKLKIKLFAVFNNVTNFFRLFHQYGIKKIIQKVRQALSLKK